MARAAALAEPVQENDPDPDRFRHTEVDGSKVVGDVVLLSGLGKAVGYEVPLRGTRVLTLADGRRVYACRDCDFLGTQTREEDGVPVLSTRGEIRKHRSDKHGVTKSGPPRGRRRGGDASVQAEELPLDDIDQVGLAYPGENVRGLSVGDLLEFAEHVDQWGRVMGALTDDRDQWKERAMAAERRVREFERTLERTFGKLLPSMAAADGEGK